MTITEFLLARIAEDEAMARQEDADYAHTTLLPTYDSEHQVNWDTERVLAECKAKRAIVEGVLTIERDPQRHVDALLSAQYKQWLNWFVIPFARIHKDHPDYHKGWPA